jgi:hypothetical protein
MYGRAGKANVLAAGLAVAAIFSTAGCAGTVDQAVCDDVALLETQLDGISSQITPEVEQEVRDDYSEMATEANCPGYNNPDN